MRAAEESARSWYTGIVAFRQDIQELVQELIDNSKFGEAMRSHKDFQKHEDPVVHRLQIIVILCIIPVIVRINPGGLVENRYQIVGISPYPLSRAIAARVPSNTLLALLRVRDVKETLNRERFAGISHIPVIDTST